jgi:hypothetical protein
MADLIARIHDGAPGMLATYASYPTTEYLQVPGQDFACANVFLDDPTTLRSYLRHLMAQVGELPWSSPRSVSTRTRGASPARPRGYASSLTSSTRSAALGPPCSPLPTSGVSEAIRSRRGPLACRTPPGGTAQHSGW